MLIVWGRANAANVMKITWLLEELRTPYQRRDAGGSFGGLDSPGFTALNPNRHIPVLQDGDFVLWESNAILRYVAMTVPGAGVLYPQSPRERANIDRWLDWQQTELATPMARLQQWAVRTPAHLRVPGLIERASATTSQLMTMLEQTLGDQGGLTGRTLSLADFGIGPLLHRWFSLPVRRPALPKLAAYHDRLLDRPAYVAHATLPPSAVRVEAPVKRQPQPLRVVA
jgi:glutathione S-transferase